MDKEIKPKLTKETKPKAETIDETEAKDLKTKIDELKKEKTKEELLKIVSVQPETHDLRDFLAARKALDDMGVEYNKTFA